LEHSKITLRIGQQIARTSAAKAGGPRLTCPMPVFWGGGVKGNNKAEGEGAKIARIWRRLMSEKTSHATVTVCIVPPSPSVLTLQ